MGSKDGIENRPTRRAFVRIGTLASAGALIIAGLAIGFNVGGVRQWLFGNRPRIQAIAVLPLQNLSRDPKQDYLADAITGELGYEVSLIGTFRVTAGNSTARYKKGLKPLPDVGRELNVDAVIQGGVQRLGDRVRVELSVSHAPTDRPIWQHTYERSVSETPVLMAEISREIAREIRAELPAEQAARFAAARPVTPQALDAYWQSQYGEGDAETLLHQAIQLDPGFAKPFSSLAGAYYWSNFWPAVPPQQTYPKVREAAQKALDIDPANAPAHFYSALVLMDYEWKFRDAEQEFKRNLELRQNCANTHHMYAHFLLSVGRMQEAVAETRRALEIEPIDEGLITCVAWHDIAMDRYEDAEKRLSEARKMGASGPFVELLSGWCYEQQGRFDESISALQKAVVGSQGAVFPTAALGHAYASAGKKPAAQEVLDKLLERSRKEYVSAYEIAALYAGMGEKNRAFAWLDKAYQERASFLAHFRMDPRFRELQSDARFRDLLVRMKFPQGREY